MGKSLQLCCSILLLKVSFRILMDKILLSSIFFTFGIKKSVFKLLYLFGSKYRFPLRILNLSVKERLAL